MDMLDQALDNSGHEKTNDSAGSDDVHLTGAPDGDALVAVDTGEGNEEQAAAIASVTGQAGLTLDPSVQYQFRTDTGTYAQDPGQVTYRVVQVAQDGEQAQVVTAAGFPTGAPAVIQSPFSNGGSPSEDALADTRFTYVPTVTAAGDGTDGSGGQLGQVSTAGGQFYVMMSPQDVLQGQRNIAPRTGSFAPKVEGTRGGRDERRRATHNEGMSREIVGWGQKAGRNEKQRATHSEVERRRRDKINNWIVQLSKMIPECAHDHTKQGQVSKGGILSKACDYITELRTANARMGESLKETERLSVDAELLRQQCEELKQENAMLRAQMQQHGIVVPDLTGATS